MSTGRAISARIDCGVGRSIFGVDAEGYHRARPGYPEALYAKIAEGSPGLGAIAEIGPGTGIATEALARWAPDRFVAFEPDTVLAAYLRGRFPTLEVVNDDFAAADVPGGFDLIAAASCFHWLHAPAALAQARRFLRPGGTLALWWNVYRQAGIGAPFAEAVLPLLHGTEMPPSEAATGHYALDEALHREQLGTAGFSVVRHHVFRRERNLSPAEARALYASFSMVRILPDRDRTALLDAIEAIVSERFAGSAPNVVLTPLYLATSA